MGALPDLMFVCQMVSTLSVLSGRWYVRTLCILCERYLFGAVSCGTYILKLCESAHASGIECRMVPTPSEGCQMVYILGVLCQVVPILSLYSRWFIQ